MHQEISALPGETGRNNEGYRCQSENADQSEAVAGYEGPCYHAQDQSDADTDWLCAWEVAE